MSRLYPLSLMIVSSAAKGCPSVKKQEVVLVDGVFCPSEVGSELDPLSFYTRGWLVD